MTITNKRTIIKNQYQMGNEILSRKEKIKYLEITIDNKLTFKEHIQDESKKAMTILNMLKRNLYFAPRKVKEKSYTSCVLPILEYASTCWSSTSKKCQNMLEMVHP